MRTYGLIGKNLSHSFSPEYFKEKFRRLGIEADYKLFEINDIEEFPGIIQDNPELIGLNVTIPYKRSLGMYMDYNDDIVHITGSLNTIKIDRSLDKPVLSGFNTDVIGFENTIKPYLKSARSTRAMILGTGGSANSVAFVLRKLGILFTFLSRKPSKLLHFKYTWVDSEDIRKNNLIINTTPIGMYPDEADYPNIPYDYLTEDHILYDLIYNPNETLFMKKGREKGATCINGREMLKIQAEASWKIWNKKRLFTFW